MPVVNSKKDFQEISKTKENEGLHEISYPKYDLVRPSVLN